MPKIYDYEQNSKGEYVLKNVQNFNPNQQKKRRVKMTKLELGMGQFLNGFAIGSFYIDRVKQLLRTCGLDV